MGKQLDWEKLKRPGFDDRRRQAHGQTTGKELFRKAHEQEMAQKADFELKRSQEPLLRGSLIDYMVNRKPILVLSDIKNPTECLDTELSKSQGEEDDGFYHSSPSVNSERPGSFVEVMETIPAGSQLIFKSWEKTLGQWIFQAQNGKEYAIYDKSIVMFQNRSIQNPGFYGLLYNTNILEEGK